MFSFTPYIVLPLFSAIVTFAVALYAWRRRGEPAASAVFRAMLVLALWSGLYALNLSATHIAEKVFLSRAVLPFYALAGIATLAVAAEVTGFGSLLSRRRIAPLLVLIAVLVFAAWAEPIHYMIVQHGPPALLVSQAGPVRRTFAVFVALLVVAAVGVLLAGLQRRTVASRSGVALIIVGTLVPLLTEWLAPPAIRGIGPAASLFWFTGCCYTLAVFRHGLFEVAPVARAALFDYLGDPVLIFDPKGGLRDCNRAAQVLLRPGRKALFADLRAALVRRLPSLPTSLANAAFTLDDSVADCEESGRFWQIKSLPLMKGGWMIGTLVQLHDVSSLKQSELESRRAHEAAQAVANAKTAFLANMSHEIRTPLNAIIGMTGLTLDTDLTAEQREYLETVKQSAGSLLLLLNDVLDYSKIEAGRLDLEEIDFDLSAVLATAEKTVSFQAKEKGLRIERRVEPGTPGALRGDPVRLQQVLMNLLGNAVKFTARGSVSLTVAREETDRAAGIRLRFSVADTGIGISADKLQSIFEEFTQADGSITRRYGGSGLGLSIARSLVRLMQGDLRVQSEPGKGSVFSFSAGFQPVLAPPAPGGGTAGPVLAPAPPRPLRILVAEDMATNRTLVTRLLERRGHRVVAVSDGQEAVRTLETDDFDVVLLDVQMPVMDGLEASRTIRDPQSRVLRHDVPVVALTAHALAEDRERCLQAGMNEYLSKPIVPDLLIRTVERFAADERADDGRSGVAAPPQPTEPGRGTVNVGEIKTALVAAFQGDRDLAEEIWQTFTDEAPRLLAAIGEALAKHDAHLVAFNAHTLKSAAGAVGLRALQERAAALEVLGKAGSLENAEMLFAEMKRIMEACTPTGG